MPQVGANNLSIRGSEGWRGMSVITPAERGDRRLDLVINGYVSPDGSELRTFPGWKCVVDPVSQGRTAGYWQNVIDATRPVVNRTGGYDEWNDLAVAGGREQLLVWNKQTNLHSFHFVRNQIKVIGESDFRREPIVTSGYVEVTVESWQEAADTILTVSAVYVTGAVFNGLDGSATPRTNVVWVTGLTDDGGLLNDKMHLVKSFNAANRTITLETNTSSLGADVHGGQTGTIAMVRYPDPDTGLSGGLSYYGAVSGTDDPEALTIWTCIDTPDVDATNPISTVYPAYVANRQRDFGDQTGWIVEGDIDVQLSRRRQRSLPYRLVPHVAGERVIMAAPQYGCVFQAPSMLPVDITNGGGGIYANFNDVFDKPRAQGMPKAAMAVDTAVDWATSQHFYTSSTTNSYGGDNPDAYGARAGTYRFQVAYRDDATGEIGLASEMLSLVTPAAGTNKGIQIMVLFPGYLMSEVLGHTVLLYRSKKSAAPLGLARAIPMQDVVGATVSSAKYGLTPQKTSGAFTQNFIAYFKVPWIEDDDLDMTQAPPELPQMPMGVKAARTVRNATIYGGYLGNDGPSKELVTSTITSSYDLTTVPTGYPLHDVLTCRMAQFGTPIALDGNWLVGQNCIPPAYISCNIYGQLILPFPLKTTELTKFDNIVVQDVTSPYIFWPRYEIAPTTLIEGTQRYPKEGLAASLILPRGRLQIAELDNPGSVPATNSVYIDCERDEDVEAIGSAKGQAVICTKSSTFYLGWSQSPAGGIPEMVNGEFGCIAANTMCETDAGTFWISERGPVMFSGGDVDWIGRDFEPWFHNETGRYKRDSMGMMRHAWACHDQMRGLVYFGLYADLNAATVTYRGTSYTWATASDEAKSRFPCDEVLIYSYRAQAWSLWRPPVGLEVLWMERGQDADGHQRVCFLAADGRIYALDDEFGQWNRDPHEAEISVVNSTTQFTVEVADAFGDNLASFGSADNHVAVGMNVLILDSTKTIYRGHGKVSNYSVANRTVNIDTAVTFEVGDVALLGVRDMEVRSNSLNFKDSEDKTSVRGIAYRYSASSRFSRDPVTYPLPQPLFCRTTVTANKKITDSAGYATTQATVATYDYMGQSEGIGLVRTHTLNRGLPTAQEHKVTTHFIGGAQVKLVDMVGQIP